MSSTWDDLNVPLMDYPRVDRGLSLVWGDKMRHLTGSKQKKQVDAEYNVEHNITYIYKYGAEHNTIMTHKCWNSWVRDRTPCNLSSFLRIPEEVAVKRCHYAW